ncbi:MAG: hypothetical protein JSW00_11525 [Thermoplasmata archaeon]|nr:MAG: hypothetical protein JSW00_11525 [Thermoplasmata archaeon]
MSDAKVHNYAFRKALGYVRTKRGRLGSESIRKTYVSATHQFISTRSPYLPSYMPVKSFVILLQIIKNNLGEKKGVNSEKVIHRCYDVGFYLYSGPEEKDSPYQYLDPHKELKEVMGEFYHNLETPSAIFKDCETDLETSDSKITVTWKKLDEYPELFHYLEGLHAGMIKESKSDGELSAQKKRGDFIYIINLRE